MKILMASPSNDFGSQGLPTNLVAGLYTVLSGCILRVYESGVNHMVCPINDPFEPLSPDDLVRYPYLGRISHKQWIFMRSNFSITEIFEAAQSLAFEETHRDQAAN